MTVVAIGELRHHLVLERLERVPDAGGGAVESWVEEATLWAAIRPRAGGETVEAGRLAGRVSHDVYLRYRAGVVPAMRFRWGGRIFHILAVLDIGERRQWLRCLCEERDL